MNPSDTRPPSAEEISKRIRHASCIAAFLAYCGLCYAAIALVQHLHWEPVTVETFASMVWMPMGVAGFYVKLAIDHYFFRPVARD